MLVRLCGVLLAGSLFILALGPLAWADSDKDLVKAVEKADQGRIEKALHKGASPEAKDSEGKPVLVLAAGQCRLWMVELLVSKGASVQADGAEAWKASSVCDCSHGIAAFLIEKGLPLPTPGTDSCGRTPLMVAAQQGRTDIVKALLTGGPAPNERDKYGSTAVDYAIYSGHDDIVKLLVELGHATPVSIATVKDEHEVYIWRASPEASNTFQSRWTISGTLGKGDLRGTSFPIDPEYLLEMAAGDPGPAPGFEPWYFAPEKAEDRCTIESGSALVSIGMARSGPAIFAPASAYVAGAGMYWLRADGQSAIRFHAVLYPASNGELALGGAIFLYSTVVPGAGGAAHNIPAAAATVTGKIRFPPDTWTSAKVGFKIRGGGLQFDETGVFLIPGTQYLKETP